MASKIIKYALKNKNTACLGCNYNNNKAVQSSSGKFCFNIDELFRTQMGVTLIYVEFRYFLILSFYNDMIDRLMDQ